MNKQVTVDDGVRTVQLYREAGIEVAGFLHRRLPGRDRRRRSNRHSAWRCRCRSTRSPSTCPTRCPGRCCSRGSAVPTTAPTGHEENEVTFVYRSEFDDRLAAAPHRRDHGGFRVAPLTRRCFAPRLPALSQAPQQPVGRPLEELAGPRGASLPRRRFISNCTWPLTMAKRILVAETPASKVSVWLSSRPPCCRHSRGPALAEPFGEGRARQRIGHRQPQVVERQRAGEAQRVEHGVVGLAGVVEDEEGAHLEPGRAGRPARLRRPAAS